LLAFVDTNVIVYAKVAPTAELSQACSAVMRAIGGGAIRCRASVAVIEEVWHLELRGRPAGLDGTTNDAYLLFTPLLAVTDEIFRDALAIDAGSLGSNDRVHAATCAAHGIDTILSADAGFDGVAGLRRVDPLDRDAVAALTREEA